ncbi:hypothetical protein RvY_02568 [Ramazzottius varieornatus]|uniref:Uncharacterized protein n=1 Tax=Ramazzottius varieornatus TaxID=947166 RepID=A0A1D1UK70_RAMVA|nr:hypothetical protein RvY_02568 [Ramazzottius varieornatus]
MAPQEQLSYTSGRNGCYSPTVCGLRELSDGLLLEVIQHGSFHSNCRMRRVSVRFNETVRLSLKDIAFAMKDICLVSGEMYEQYLKSFDRPGGDQINSLLVYGIPYGQSRQWVFPLH